jgi:hypothetical protein
MKIDSPGIERKDPVEGDMVIHDPDGSDVYSVPDISKLKYSFSVESPGARKMMLEDLVPDLDKTINEDLSDAKTEKRKRGRPRKQK